MHEARQYAKIENGTVKCSLCNHRCTIADGKHGICGVRQNTGGTLYASTYGLVSAEAVDPIEKKPLFHYLPGTSRILSAASGAISGASTARTGIYRRQTRQSPACFPISPERRGWPVPSQAGARAFRGPYNEPTIWHEYTLDMGTLARAKGSGHAT